MCVYSCIQDVLAAQVCVKFLGSRFPSNNTNVLLLLIIILTLVISQKAEVDASGHHSTDVRIQDIWLDKAEVCLSLGLYQPARQLLAEAHLVATVS